MAPKSHPSFTYNPANRPWRTIVALVLRNKITNASISFHENICQTYTKLDNINSVRKMLKDMLMYHFIFAEKRAVCTLGAEAGWS